MVRENPQALLDAASRLMRAGRVPEAIEAHERLLALRPDLADSWYNLAYLQTSARHYEAALSSYQRALELGVACPEEVHLNRAVVLAGHLGRSDEAEKELRVALALNARYVPALLNLGNIHEQRGERDPALAAYEEVLSIDPVNALALARLPNLKPTMGPDDPVIAQLKRAIARPGAGSDERADLGFGLGKALDSAGSYDDAFAAYVAANQASRQSAAGGARYDAAAHERFVDALIRAFPEPVPSSAGGQPSTSPVFICGMFRSGSSLVEQILASHPRVSAGGEIDLLPMMAKEHLGPHLREPFAPLGEPLLQRMRATYLDGVSTRFAGADVMTDKRPDNFLYIGLIKALFPDAKIVHTRRDPVDNCLSVFFLHLGHSMPYALDLLDAAHWYKQYRRLMAHWTSLYGDAIHDVDYDGLVLEPRPAIERLLEHCGLPWHDGCLAFHQTRSIVMTPSAWQVRQPLYTRSSGRWQHYARHLDGLRAALSA